MQHLELRENQVFNTETGLNINTAILVLDTIVHRLRNEKTTIIANVYASTETTDKVPLSIYSLDISNAQIEAFETATETPFFESVDGQQQLTIAALNAVLDFDNPIYKNEKIGDRWRIAA